MRRTLCPYLCLVVCPCLFVFLSAFFSLSDVVMREREADRSFPYQDSRRKHGRRPEQWRVRTCQSEAAGGENWRVLLLCLVNSSSKGASLIHPCLDTSPTHSSVLLISCRLQRIATTLAACDRDHKPLCVALEDIAIKSERGFSRRCRKSQNCGVALT